MKCWRFVLWVYLLIWTVSASAQSFIKGTVYQDKSSVKLSDVFIRNLSNQATTLSDAAGNFEIEAAPNQLLVFSSPGYVSDTLFLIDLKPKMVHLFVKGIVLNEVNISASGEFNPREEYDDVYRRAKITSLSPSQIFGKEAKQARRFKRFLDWEVKERKIDAVFNKKLIAEYLPLTGVDLENFMSLYRPSFMMVNSTKNALVLYLNDCYKKFMALSPEERKLSPLKGE